MPYLKNSFLIPVSEDDTTVKIKDSAGQIKFIIKEPDATLSVSGSNLIITQKAGNTPIIIDFNTAADASMAIVLLKTELSKIRKKTEAKHSSNVPAVKNGIKCETTYNTKPIISSRIWSQSDLIPVTPPILRVNESFGVIKRVEVKLRQSPKDSNAYYSEDLADMVLPSIFGNKYKPVLKSSLSVIIDEGWRDWYLDEECLMVRFSADHICTEHKLDANNLPSLVVFKYIGEKGIKPVGITSVQLKSIIIIPGFNGQQIFNLGEVTSIYKLSVNGQNIDNIADTEYHIDGNLLFWHNLDYQLEMTDTIKIEYY
jgi:hypothetical protein